MHPSPSSCLNLFMIYSFCSMLASIYGLHKGVQAEKTLGNVNANIII